MADSLYAEEDGKLKRHRDDSLLYKPVQHELLVADKTLVAGDDGNVYQIGAVDLNVVLPATIEGFTVTFVVTTISTTGFTLSPVAADLIAGTGITAAVNKHIINTGATDAVGDLIQVVGDGTDGWLITNMIGTWAREA